MLFNSPIFIFVFLPIVILTFNVVGGRGHHRAAITWLVLASLFFYGWWNPAYLILICISLVSNYTLGSFIVGNRSKVATVIGVCGNLAVLGYYKYANFFIENINPVFGTDYHFEKIVLPLAISFFTFEQISYLVDSYKGNARNYKFMDYCLFVLFFPQLIAGPIVHHHEMIPQFENSFVYRFRLQRFNTGLTIFFIGLFKKVCIADTVAQYSTPVFDAALVGATVSFFAAWGGALAYSFQLYYDFSGYSDMAIGIALMVGIRMPLNFHSPYKATNIIDFWRRWHMTLSRFLREYLYIPLGGSRKGKIRRHINLMITMLLGGLWHGAGWTFVIWGGLHGCYLVINHLWVGLRGGKDGQSISTGWVAVWPARIITFFAVVVAWVFFRAESLDCALGILRGMTGLNGFTMPSKLLPILNYAGSFGTFLQSQGVAFMRDSNFADVGYLLIILLLVFTWTAPNTQQFMARYKPTVTTFDGELLRHPRFQWRLTRYSAVFSAVLTVLAFLGLNEVSEFLYFQF